MTTVLKALAIVFTFGFMASSAAADITIFRGSTMEKVSTGKTRPVLLRGGGSLREPAAAPSSQSSFSHIAAGKTLWLVDENAGEITACTTRNSSYAGKRRIICSRHK